MKSNTDKHWTDVRANKTPQEPGCNSKHRKCMTADASTLAFAAQIQLKIECNTCVHLHHITVQAVHAMLQTNVSFMQIWVSSDQQLA